MKPRDRITANQIIRRCRRGAALCMRLGRGGAAFTIQPPGDFVQPRYARRAIASGQLVAAHDGLFSDSSQTWIIKSEVRPLSRASDHMSGSIITPEHRPKET